MILILFMLAFVAAVDVFLMAWIYNKFVKYVNKHEEALSHLLDLKVSECKLILTETMNQYEENHDTCIDVPDYLPFEPERS